MTGLFSFFTEIALILGLATGMALVMYWLRLPLILGHLLTGILVGPVFFHILQSEQMVSIFSELGITCLLFIVGLHVSPRVFKEVGASSFVTGAVQMVGMTSVGSLLLFLLGVSTREALFLGFLLSLSSTIVITKVLSDRKDLGKLYGKITVGVLLVQDIVATCVITLLPFLGQGSGLNAQAIAWVAGKIALLVLLVWIGARVLLPRLTGVFARSQEFLFLFSVSWGIGLASLFAAFGFSHEVGALVAGVALASSPYHFEISARMKVLRDFFIVLFFVLLGAQLGWGGAQRMVLPAVLLSLALLIVNPLLVALALRGRRYPARVSWLSALSFTQVSEFSLILLIVGTRQGLVSADGRTLLTLITLITMFISTLWMLRSSKLLAALLRLFPDARSTQTLREQRQKESYDIILLGCHRLGQDFLATLRKGKHSFLVVDFDPSVISSLEREGIACRYGDIEDNEFMDELNLRKTKMVISTIPNLSTNLFILDKLRKQSKSTLMLAMAHAVEEALQLYEAGATYVVMPYFIGGNYSSLLIDKYGCNAKKFSQERLHHLRHLHKRKNVTTGQVASDEYKHLLGTHRLTS